jgi:hypothetical protein
MSARHLVSTGALAAAIAVVSLVTVNGQGPAVAAKATASKAGAKPFQTSWGDPDLQGIWANKTTTPLERPAKYAGKAVLTKEELAQAENEAAASRFRDTRDHKPGAVTDVGRAYDAHWFDRTGKPIQQTSLIIDPPDGKIPPMTVRGKKRYADWADSLGRTASPTGLTDSNSAFGTEGEEDGTVGGVDGRGTRADNPEDRRFSERCLVWGEGIPRLPGGYNNNFRIVQSPGYVVIELEMIHDARVIPLDGRPHLPSSVRSWLGDARGHWEGNTLVVDTTNFNDNRNFKGSFEGMHLVERFTRIDASTVDYRVTIEDPQTWVKPWTVAFPLVSLQSIHDTEKDDVAAVPQMFEYACHEGNYGLAGQLRGQRAVDASAAVAGAKKGSR